MEVDKKASDRWDDGPTVGGAAPILVYFACNEDKTAVWKCLKNGCRSTSVVVTQDSKARREKDENSILTKRRKKSSFHANCYASADSEDLCCDDNVEEERDAAEVNKNDAVR